MEKELNMKRTFILLCAFFLVPVLIIKAQDTLGKIFILIPTTNEKGTKISYSEHKRGILIGAYITFDVPNYTVIVSHMPPWVDYPSEGNREQIEVTASDMLNSSILCAEKLTFNEWSELEQIGLKQKIYMVFQEDYLSKDRFVLNHQFKAYEVRVTADGPI
ncbi:MAG: hypothetical protein ACXIUD_08855 [Mongoliitalea sp.]